MRFKTLTLISALAAIVALTYFDVPTANIINNLYAPLPSVEQPHSESNAAATSAAMLHSEEHANNRVVVLSPSRRAHILYGDRTGGGHKHGINKPCKSEFPADWDDKDIIKTIKRIAANDNLSWEKQRNGYYVAEELGDDGTKVRVVLGPEKKHIITAYPTNITRNPCPANDNR